jgi:methionyl-tRNA synthetase
MVQKYFGGTLPAEQLADEAMDAELISLAEGLRDKYEAQMEKFQFQNALAEVFKVISRANKYIDENAPWVLAKDEANKPRLAKVMYNLLATIRICGALLQPMMPETSDKIQARIGAADCGWDTLADFHALPVTATVTAGEALFPRIDMNKELEALEALLAPAAEEPAEEPVTFKENINFDTFEQVDMTVVKVLECEAVKKSKKLLRFTLDDGSGTPRQILSGIAAYYKPEDLVGKTLVAVTNLAPRKMMGLESCGMLLSAEKNDKLNLIMVDDSIPAGAKLC